MFLTPSLSYGSGLELTFDFYVISLQKCHQSGRQSVEQWYQFDDEFNLCCFYLLWLLEIVSLWLSSHISNNGVSCSSKGTNKGQLSKLS